MIDNKMDDKLSIYELLLKINNLIIYLLKKWKVIVLFCLIGCIIGYFFSVKNDSIYKAEIKFIVKDDKPSSLNSAFASSLGFDLNPIEDSMIYSSEIFTEIFQSRRVIEKSLLKTFIFKNKEITLADYYLNQILSNYNSFSNSTLFFLKKDNRNLFSRHQDSLLNLIYKNIISNHLTIEKLNDNDKIFTAQLSSKNEEFSIRFLNSIIGVISDDFKFMKMRNITLMTQRIDSLKLETKKMLEYKNINNSQILRPDLKYYLSDKDELDIDLNLKILTKLTEQLEILKLNLINDSQLIQVIDSPVRPLPDLKTDRKFSILLFGFLSGLIVVIAIVLSKSLSFLRK